MNIIDSSGWLEYFTDGPNADHYLPLLNVIVPVITIYAVFKVVLRESDENEALQAVAAMHEGTITDLNANLAMNASKLSQQHNLPMAGSTLLATARAYDCTIWTQDSDFQHIEGVNYFPT